MALLTRVRRMLGEQRVIYECRQCGTTLESKLESCDTCGATETVRYTIE